MIPKLIYFAERHPALGREGFRARWREHGRLGMSLPRWRNVLRYTQGDALDGDAACDGVATVLFRSEAARLAHIADPDGAVTRADEAAVFARPVRMFAVLTIETPFLPQGPGGLKLYARVHRQASVDAADFRAWWSGTHGPAFADALRRVDPAAGYSQNLRHPAEAGTGPDAVEELSPAALPACVDLLRRTAADPVIDGWVAAIDWIAVHETVLHDARQT